ncbi:uncharacterized protein LOC134534367 isoform X3 [Bacillus rossius redtenbacheri]|uniref:uncharacterized protein LOC134534367 isoform X3 n=1 Tax=Bacillus rossius redtenbacheri TaxID=93214 RepID=UPI002FDE5CFC
MLRAALELEELTSALRGYFTALREVQRAWQGQLAECRDPLRVLLARLEELRLVRSAQLHARVAHLRELRVRVDGCVQQLGWSRLAQCDHFLRGSGATPAPVAMLEWVHDSCLYYQQAILRINNTLSVIVEDDDASRCNLKSAFQEEDESKKQLQGCVVQRGPGRSTAAASPRPRHSASLVTCIEHNVRHLCRNVGTHVLLRAGEWPAVSAPVRMPRTAATAVSSHMLNKPHETALKF